MALPSGFAALIWFRDASRDAGSARISQTQFDCITTGSLGYVSPALFEGPDLKL
ncbi:MAG: hypothetical protein AAGC92_12885 [Pseudomonadota bacterium]